MFGEIGDEDSDNAMAVVTLTWKQSLYGSGLHPHSWVLRCTLAPPRDGFGGAEGHPHIMLIPLQNDGMETPGQEIQWEFPG